MKYQYTYQTQFMSSPWTETVDNDFEPHPDDIREWLVRRSPLLLDPARIEISGIREVYDE